MKPNRNSDGPDAGNPGQPLRSRFDPVAIAIKTHDRGLAWLWARLVRELRVPETTLGDRLLRISRPVVTTLRALPRALLVPMSGGWHAEKDTLFLFYDLEVSPVTYDFLWALVAAEIKRRSLGLTWVHVVFVPGPEAGLRREEDLYEKNVDADARRLRIHDLLIPACTLLPTCSGYSFCASRNQAAVLLDTIVRHVHPATYSPTFPVPNRTVECLELIRGGADPFVLKAPPRAQTRIREWMDSHAGGRKVVAITLRDYGFHPERNSNSAAWAKFARDLDAARFLAVIVPDTEKALAGLESVYQGLTIFSPAAINLPLRAALYEQAYLNLGVNTGPLLMASFMRESRYLMLKIRTEGAPQTTDMIMRWHGFDIGASLPFATDFQKWVWEDDSLETIQREFSAMTKRLDPG